MSPWKPLVIVLVEGEDKRQQQPVRKEEEVRLLVDLMRVRRERRKARPRREEMRK